MVPPQNSAASRRGRLQSQPLQISGRSSPCSSCPPGRPGKGLRQRSRRGRQPGRACTSAAGSAWVSMSTARAAGTEPGCVDWRWEGFAQTPRHVPCCSRPSAAVRHRAAGAVAAHAAGAWAGRRRRRRPACAAGCSARERRVSDLPPGTRPNLLCRPGGWCPQGGVAAPGRRIAHGGSRTGWPFGWRPSFLRLRMPNLAHCCINQAACLHGVLLPQTTNTVLLCQAEDDGGGVGDRERDVCQPAAAGCVVVGRWHQGSVLQ